MESNTALFFFSYNALFSVKVLAIAIFLCKIPTEMERDPEPKKGQLNNNNKNIM